MNYRLVLGVLLATVVGFYVHIALSPFIESYISQEMAGMIVLHPPYPFWVTTLALITAMLPVAGWSILFFLVYDRIPISNFFWKGLAFSFLIFLLKGDLFRQQIMAYAIGNPIDVVLVQSLDPILPNLLIGIILSASIKWFKSV